MKTLADIVTEFLARPGMTQKRLADAMETSQQAIQQVAAGKTLRPRYISELIEFIENHAPDMKVRDALPPGKFPKKSLVVDIGKALPFEPRTTSQLLDIVGQPTDMGFPKRDLPLFASAEGGNGEVLISHDPIDFVDRPLRLANVRNAYAIYVINDSMAPALKPGNILQVNPSRPPQPGRYVVLVLRDEVDEATGDRRCMVKEFVRKTSDRIFLRQYNPEREFDIALSMIESIHPVTGLQFD